jgi:D,D-heptose 1,7-bisphosphate phosphatase
MNMTGMVYRPPYEANSLLLQVTHGCSHNKCTFCSMYPDVRFSVCPMEEVEEDIEKGKVRARNLKHPQKAVFLDRDGTINQYVGFLTKAEQFELIPQVEDAIKLINKSGYLTIVVTNQPVIARGDCDWEDLRMIHDKMETDLGKSGAFVDGIYVCPHHPDKGFEGERPEYKINCDCRKPKAGLFLKAASDYHIDLSQSVMIGDSDDDVEAGRNAGLLHSVKIERNKPGALEHVLSEILKSL